MKNNKGFTLLELSIVLVILGLMTTLSIDVTKGYISYKQNQETQKKIENIKVAINDYVIKNNKLPCPANIKLNYSEKEPVSSCTNGIREVNGFLVGTIPTETLQISKSNLYDSWFSKFIFIVSKDYTNDISSESSNLINNKFIYTIISAGSSKESTYTYKSTEIRNKKTSSNEYINSYDGFNGNIITDTNKNIVLIETKSNILQNTGLFNLGCKIKESEVRSKINNICGSNYFKSSLNLDLKYSEKYNSIENLYSEKSIDMPDGTTKKIYTDFKECVIECTKFGRYIIYINKVNI